MKKFLDNYLKRRARKNEDVRKSYTEEELKSEIANSVKKIREDLNLSQVQFAERVGVHRSTISKIESKDLNVSLTTLNSIADKCGYDFAFTLKKREDLEINGLQSKREMI